MLPIWLACLTISIVLIVFASLRFEFNYAAPVLCAATSLLVALVLYREYLLGDALFLYSVSDGYSQYLPTYMNYANMLSDGNGIEWWTFSSGFGSIQSYDVLLYPLNFFPVLSCIAFGEIGLHICFAWMQVVKIVLASFFMYMYLKRLHLNTAACVFGAIIYSLCGIIIFRGFWGFPADECYIAAMLLCCVERYLQDGKWALIPPCVFLLGICLGFYYLYLYGLLLTAYATLRFIYRKMPIRSYVPFMLKNAGLYLLGVMAWGVVLVGFSWALFNTVRFSSTGNYIAQPAFYSHASPGVLINAILSLYDTNITGIYYEYTGVLNYLERPLFYSGLVAVFLIVQAFVLGKGRVKSFLAIALCSAFLYMFFPIITDIFNAFIRNEELASRSYRLSSLWIEIAIIVTSSYGFQCVIDNKSFNKRAVLSTSAILAFVFLYLCLESNFNQIHINYNIARWVVVFLLVWTGVLYFAKIDMRIGKRGIHLFVILIVLIGVAEVAHSSYLTVNASSSESKEAYRIMKDNDLGYYGDVKAAISYIKSVDNGLYRISGIRPSPGTSTCCTPLYFGIFDSSYYTNIDYCTYSFINEVYPESFLEGKPGYKYSEGVGDNECLSALTGYKYQIVKRTEHPTVLYGYTLIKSYDTVDVYRNNAPLSMGITYNKYISRTDFQNLNKEEQRLALLEFVVLDDGQATALEVADNADLVAIGNAAKNVDSNELYDSLLKERTDGELNVTSWTQNHIVGAVDINEDRTLSFSTPNLQGWNVYVDGVKTETKTVNFGFIGFDLSPGKHTVELIYEPKTLPYGIIMSLAALFVYCGMLMRSKKKAREFSQKSNNSITVRER